MKKKIQKRKRNKGYVFLEWIISLFGIITILALLIKLAVMINIMETVLFLPPFILSILAVSWSADAFEHLSYERGTWVDLSEEEQDRFRVK